MEGNCSGCAGTLSWRVGKETGREEERGLEQGDLEEQEQLGGRQASALLEWHTGNGEGGREIVKNAL